MVGVTAQRPLLEAVKSGAYISNGTTSEQKQVDIRCKCIYKYSVHGAATQSGERAAQQALSPAAYAWRDGGLGICLSTPRGIRSRNLPSRGQALHYEKQRRVKTKGEKNLTRQSYQQGNVSDPIRTRRGLVYRIRCRLRTSDGKWMHKSERLQGLSGKKAARAVLDQRIRDSQSRPAEAVDFTFQQVLDALWRPYLDRKHVKPSTRRSY